MMLEHHEKLAALAISADGGDGLARGHAGHLGLVHGGHTDLLWCPSCGLAPLSVFGEPLMHRQGEEPSADDDLSPEPTPEDWAWMFTCPNPTSYCDPITITGRVELRGPMLPASWSADDPSDDIAVMVRTIHPAYSLLDGRAKRWAPQTVVDHARAAGALLWMDGGAAANRMRSATEELLNALDVPAQKSTGTRLNLFDRITEGLDAGILNQRAHDLLHGMRILGNSGSHAAADTPRIEVVNGGRVLSEAIRELYPDPNRTAADADVARWQQSWRQHKII